MTKGMSDNASRTRERILAAASEIARTGSGTRISVRAVALRAGVGVGTLRYHFPTQRELHDAVLTTIYEEAMPDDRIRDSSIDPSERLVDCLRQILAPVGIGDGARQVWSDLFRAFIDPAVAPEPRDVYLELSRQALGRVESWLSILTEEGAIPAGDTSARARFLMTVVNGLAIQRALPSSQAALEAETEVLEEAVGRLVVAERTNI